MHDFLSLLLACATGEPVPPPRFADDVGLTVVMAARGYPGVPKKGGSIGGLEKLGDVIVTQAGTRAADGAIVADGGRVLNVTALAPSVAEARTKAYAALAKIEWPDGFYRTDIGAKAARAPSPACGRREPDEIGSDEER